MATIKASGGCVIKGYFDLGLKLYWKTPSNIKMTNKKELKRVLREMLLRENWAHDMLMAARG